MTVILSYFCVFFVLLVSHWMQGLISTHDLHSHLICKTHWSCWSWTGCICAVSTDWIAGWRWRRGASCSTYSSVLFCHCSFKSLHMVRILYLAQQCTWIDKKILLPEAPGVIGLAEGSEGGGRRSGGGEASIGGALRSIGGGGGGGNIEGGGGGRLPIIGGGGRLPIIGGGGGGKLPIIGADWLSLVGVCVWFWLLDCCFFCAALFFRYYS